ncbi:MAG: hypothetical protein ACKPKO_58785, partial [Candidatus Fonsibacter sp.]
MATDRFLKLHGRDFDTMRQAVVKCVIHGARVALLVFDQGSKDALERVVGFLHSSAAETLDMVKADNESTSVSEQLLLRVPQPENLGIY